MMGLSQTISTGATVYPPLIAKPCKGLMQVAIRSKNVHVPLGTLPSGHGDGLTALK